MGAKFSLASLESQYYRAALTLIAVDIWDDFCRHGESTNWALERLSTKFVDNSVDVASMTAGNLRSDRKIVKLVNFYTRHLANINQ